MFQKVSIIFVVMFVIFLPILSLAQTPLEPTAATTPNNPNAGKIENPLGNINNINDLIKTLLEGLIRIGMPIIALAIIYSGFLFVFARGNSEKLTKAKDALLYTLIGAAILLGSWGIAQLISDTVLSL